MPESGCLRHTGNAARTLACVAEQLCCVYVLKVSIPLWASIQCSFFASSTIYSTAAHGLLKLQLHLLLVAPGAVSYCVTSVWCSVIPMACLMTGMKVFRVT